MPSSSCWGYQIRDLDSTPLTMAEGKRIVAEHHQVPKKKAKARYYRATNHKADREQQESLSAPTSRPAETKPKPRRAAGKFLGTQMRKFSGWGFAGSPAGPGLGDRALAARAAHVA
jgi:hypothetical protein